MEGQRSIRKLSNEFDQRNAKKTYLLSQKQVKILDLISWGFYLSILESERYEKVYGFSNSTLKHELDSMLHNGVFKLNFFLIPEKLRSICVTINGPVGTICSLARSFLKFAPSTQARIAEGGKSCLIVSRVPEDQHYNFAKTLEEVSKEHDLSLNAYPISAYSGYRNNMYSRLLREDGMWDDDVTGLVDQVRLRPKDSS